MDDVLHPTPNATKAVFVIPPIMSAPIAEPVDIMIARDTARRAASLLGFSPVLQAQIGTATATLAELVLKTHLPHELNYNGVQSGAEIGFQVSVAVPWLADASSEKVMQALETKIGYFVDHVVFQQDEKPTISFTIWLSSVRKTQTIRAVKPDVSLDKHPLDAPKAPEMESELHQNGRILLVARDACMREMLAMTLEQALGYSVTQAELFGDGLSQLLNKSFSMVITEVDLADLSGVDLLVVLKRLRPEMPVIIIDSDMSAKTAVSCMRLGATDYIHKPINIDMLLMRVQNELESRRAAPRLESRDYNGAPDRERRFNPTTRPTALILKRKHFEHLNVELDRLWKQLRASFIGLIDLDGNLISTAGTLENTDLIALKKALAVDHNTNKRLAGILNEERFHLTHLEGERNSVYIMEFGEPHQVSLIVICPVDMKPGMVWLSSKRTATLIRETLETIETPGVG